MGKSIGGRLRSGSLAGVVTAIVPVGPAPVYSMQAARGTGRMGRSPAETNRQWCRATQGFAEQKLGRPLTPEEGDKIWNTGSFLQLEQIDMAIHHAKTPGEVEAYLAALPVRDPLPEEYTRRD